MTPITKIRSNYKGSAITRQWVREQIEGRFGKAAARAYNPVTNCLTFSQWARHGYFPKKGEQGLRSIVIIEKKNAKGEVVRRYPKNIVLFYKSQVSPIKA